MLTDDQRAELESMGAPNVPMHLMQWGGGCGADIGGFKCGNINRGDIVDWLAEQNRAEESRQSWILFWAIVGGCAGIASVVTTIYFGMK
jgi:hypothetical protein